MANLRTQDLADELLSLVKLSPKVIELGAERVLYVFDLADLLASSEVAGWPMVGVTYETTHIPDTTKGINSTGKSFNPPSTIVMLSYVFAVYTAIDYKVVNNIDNKTICTDILSEVRGIVLGHISNIHKRPWMLVDERPLMKLGEEEIIVYSQFWSLLNPFGNTQ